MYSWVSMLSYGWAVYQENIHAAEKPRELANLRLGQGMLTTWMDKLATWARSPRVRARLLGDAG